MMDIEWMKQNLFAITFDVDWAPDEILIDLLDLLSKYSVAVTLFATHKSFVLNEMSRIYEIGLHPNFNQMFLETQHETSQIILERIKSHYPDAVGIRCHSRTVSTVLIDQFINLDMLYDANQICPYQAFLAPHNYLGFCRFTDFWQDDVHAIYRRPFALSNIPVYSAGMKIFNFHPVHVYLNTESIERYQVAKSHYRNPEKLAEFRNVKIKGARDLLIELLDYLTINRKQVLPLREVAQKLLEQVTH